MTIHDLTVEQISEIATLSFPGHTFNSNSKIYREDSQIQIHSTDYASGFVTISKHLGITTVDSATRVHTPRSQHVVQRRFIEWGIEPTAKVIPIKNEPKLPKQYVGIYRTGGNVGTVWTQQVGGSYTCPTMDFNISEYDVDSDVKNGYLVEVLDKKKSEGIKMSRPVTDLNKPCKVVKEEPKVDDFDEYLKRLRKGIYLPAKPVECTWGDFIRILYNYNGKG